VSFSYGVQGVYLTNNVVPLLSVVVGLLLVFRNGSAFARWLEGRQLFSSMATGVRNLARVSWVKIGSASYDPDRVNKEGQKVPWQCENYTSKEKEEKVGALRAMVAMVVAAKHHVREEYDNETYEE
jgi:putative membrane protein